MFDLQTYYEKWVEMTLQRASDEFGLDFFLVIPGESSWGVRRWICYALWVYWTSSTWCTNCVDRNIWCVFPSKFPQGKTGVLLLYVLATFNGFPYFYAHFQKKKKMMPVWLTNYDRNGYITSTKEHKLIFLTLWNQTHPAHWSLLLPKVGILCFWLFIYLFIRNT